MAAQWREQAGRFGIWRAASQSTPEFAARLEECGFGALWLGGSPDGGLEIVDDLLAATSALTVGTSIVNMWKDDAGLVAESFARISGRFPGRFVLGIGAGHREATQEYANPYETLETYLDELLEQGVPADSVVLAALGPRVLRLAGERAAGAIPYLVTPDHTRLARGILGAGPFLGPEHKVVIDTDASRARDLGRRRVRNPYLGLANYTTNLRRLGFSDADLADGGSDRLIDALVAQGSAEQAAAQLVLHLEAGADHVAAQVLTEAVIDPLPACRALAQALGLSA
jgi:probable F420-dependent oxidoreductase